MSDSTATFGKLFCTEKNMQETRRRKIKAYLELRSSPIASNIHIETNKKNFYIDFS